MGYRAAAASNSPFGIRRGIRRRGARCGLRDRRERTPHRLAGIEGLAVDVAETALAIARENAEGRGIEVEFAEADAFQLERLGRMFDTVLDCGLFHTFDDDERPGYVASLTSVTKQDGTLYVLSFGDEGPETCPHPISQEELRAAFNRSGGWDVAAIEPDRIHTRHHDAGAPAWFATIKRI
jgi:SAM-dependent methyltransferase